MKSKATLVQHKIFSLKHIAHKFADWDCSVPNAGVHSGGRVSSCPVHEQHHSLLDSVSQVGR